MFTPAKVLISTVILTAFLLAFVPAMAKSVKDFEAMPSADQSAYMIAFVERMTNDIGRDNPKLAQEIRDYFARKQQGKPASEGIERLLVELTALDREAKEGKADLSKVQIESIILYVVKQKFPPPQK
jgi:hypothetical protein